MDRSIVLGLSISCLIGSIWYLGTQVGQGDFSQLILSYSGAFLAYGICLFYTIRNPSSALALWVGIAVLLRLMLVSSSPNLSDDIYRFLWDGHLMQEGISVLSYTPSQIMAMPGFSDAYLEQLYPLLNSPDYFTIYPPVSQLVFYLSTIGDTWSVETSITTMKLILIGFEVGTILLIIQLLRALKLPTSNVLIYALNPLVIVEVCGQTHFEGVMVFFLVAMIYFLYKKQMCLSGAMMSLSIATKLLPLMCLPLLLKFLHNDRRSLIVYFMTIASCIAILFIPFFWSLDVANFVDSLDLYFRKFEFNASVYYVLRWIGKLLTGYNQISIIGPLLSLLTIGFILNLTKKVKASIPTLIQLMSRCFVCYLLLTTTVHPWYLITLVFFSVFTRDWWIVIWAGVGILSYSLYSETWTAYHLWFVALEYLIVIGAYLIMRRQKEKEPKKYITP